MKRIKFYQNLVPIILNGEKTTTWRLFDDKDITTGDIFSFIITQTGEEFAKAKIIDVKETSFKELDEEDWEGHEKFSSKEEMFKKYSQYYNREVDENSLLKIVKFKLVK